MIDPQWGSPQQVDALRGSFGFDVSENLILETIEESVKVRDDAAVVSLLRWIAADDRLDGTALLQHSGGQETPLVHLASSAPVARIRFEAALAVSQIASQRSAAMPGFRPAFKPGFGLCGQQSRRKDAVRNGIASGSAAGDSGRNSPRGDRLVGRDAN